LKYKLPKPLQCKISTKGERFPHALKGQVGPASYESHTNKDNTMQRSARMILGKSANINFADARAKLSVSPGPAYKAPASSTWDKIAQSPSYGRKRV
jgi:hypothetical protein